MRARPWPRKVPSSPRTETLLRIVVNHRIDDGSRRGSAVVHARAPSAHVPHHDARDRARLHTNGCTALAGLRLLRMSHFKRMNQTRITGSPLTLSNKI